jgi:hypothetical protein
MKYKRTFHFPFSPEVHSDDKVQYDLSELINKEIVITEKADGGNTGFNKDNLFARTHAIPTDCPTFDYIKSVHYFPKRHLFNKDYMYFGENLYAIHSITYTALEDYLYIFNIQNKEFMLSFDDMVKEAERLDFKTVPVVFRGIFKSEKELENFLNKEIEKESFFGGEREGFVVRVAEEFKVNDFAKKVIKYVRKGHVQSDKHWKTNWKKQELKKNV